MVEDYKKLCEELNSHIPCKTQEDVDALAELLKEETIYWDKEVWMDSGFKDTICMKMLIYTDKLCFTPTTNEEEHPGVRITYKWLLKEE